MKRNQNTTTITVRHDVHKDKYRVVSAEGLEVTHPVGLGVTLLPGYTILDENQLESLEDAGHTIEIDEQQAFYKDKNPIAPKIINPNLKICGKAS